MPVTSRRRFLAVTVLLAGPALRCLRAEEPAAAVPPEKLRERAAALARQREQITDAVTPFRRGASASIEDAMRQYAEVLASFQPEPPARLRALAWALSQYTGAATRPAYGKVPRHQHVEGSVTSFGKESFKCNKLVADAYAFGAGAGLSIGADWFSEGEGTGWPVEKEGEDLWPPRANTLADPAKNLRSLTDARPLHQEGEDKAKPELGDLIAFPSVDDKEAGHVGLYLGRGLILSAKESGLEIGPVEAEREAHGGLVLIRKFTGTGK